MTIFFLVSLLKKRTVYARFLAEHKKTRAPSEMRKREFFQKEEFLNALSYSLLLNVNSGADCTDKRRSPSDEYDIRADSAVLENIHLKV